MKVGEESEPNYWKTKHRNAVREMEAQERAWHALEHILRRLVTRLCAAAIGFDTRLDAEVTRLSRAIRDEAPATELEMLFSTLSKAIAALPDPAAATQPTQLMALPTPRSAAARVTAPAPVAAAAPEHVSPPAAAPEPAAEPVVAPAITIEKRWEATIAAVASLLARLSPSEAPNAMAQALLVELQQAESDLILASIVERAADLVRERADRLTRERVEAATLLTEVTRRLDEVASFITSDSGDQRARIDDAESLNQRVMTDVRELADEARDATDLAPLRLLIAKRMDSISTQVREYRAREESRFLEHSARTTKLSKKVSDLTRKTRVLESDLDSERQRARIDALTGVANRSSFDERLSEEIARWKRAGTAVSVLFWDIDHFKSINDSFGHSAGDRVLREVARCFADRLRGSDFIARFGGEEFVTLLIGTPTSGAMKVADDLRQAVAALRMHFRGKPVSVTVSCGVTEIRSGDSSEAVLDRADVALYKAKEGGRNLCVAA